MRHICAIVFFSSGHVVNEYAHVLVVMLFVQRVAIDKVPLKLRVLEVKDIVIELLEVGIAHLGFVEGKVVSEDDFEFFGSDMSAAIDNLAFVGFDVRRFGAVHVAMGAEHIWDLIFRQIRLGPIVSFDLGAL